MGNNYLNAISLTFIFITPAYFELAWFFFTGHSTGLESTEFKAYICFLVNLKSPLSLILVSLLSYGKKARSEKKEALKLVFFSSQFQTSKLTNDAAQESTRNMQLVIKFK